MTASNFKIALLAIALSPFILNADVAVTDTSNSQRQNPDAACHSPFHRMHFGVRHTEARGVGYRDGYTTLEGFGIYDHNPNFMPFLDLRGHVFNNGKLAGNVGIGERTVLSSINHIIGAYLYYDVRQENHSFTINQLSPGFELLGKRMEYRMNGYFPVGGHRSYKYGYKFNRFQDNNILLHNRQKVALKGGDAEIGAHITQSTKYDLYAGAGPYYFAADRAHSWGGKVRLIGRYKEYVSLEASYSYDRMFRNVVQGTVGLNYPFGPKLKRKDQNCPQQNDLMLSRAAFAPYRFEIPVVKRVTQTHKAINPATDKPWQVWFVNNTSSSDGTFQSPFPTLLQAQSASGPNDMIYVFPGDGTSTGMNMGITLKNDQKLFGSSVDHKISTTKGNVTIPTFSRNAPTITNAASIVTLANGNEVSGMNIAVNAAAINANAIDGTSGINGVTIDRNSIAGSVVYSGINVLTSGAVTIKKNQITGSPSINTAGVKVLVNSNAFSKIEISENEISGFGFGINFDGNSGSSGNISVLKNAISGFGSAGIIFNDSFSGLSNSTINILKNSFLDTVSDGALGSIASSALPGSSVIFIESNSIIDLHPNFGGMGISIMTSSDSSQLFIKNNESMIQGSVTTGVRILNSGAGTLCASITGNQITAATTSIDLSTTGTGPLNISNFSGNIAPNITISGNVNFTLPKDCNP